VKKNVFYLIFIFSSIQLIGQKNEPILINEKLVGVLYEIGIPYYALEEGDKYTPLLFGETFEIPLNETKNFFNVSISIHPIFGIVFLNNSQAYEFGLNVRFNINLALSKFDVIRGSIGSGPHFMNHCTRRQAHGFLFSDYFLLSYRRFFYLNKRIYNTDIYIGYRHISNCNTRVPNGGISNFILGIGFNVVLTQYKE